MTKWVGWSTVALLVASSTWASEPVPSSFERDRQAILAMAGRFEVHFAFQETLGFQAGYTLAEPHRSKGMELVLVIEDSGRTIDLQHLLVVGDKQEVVKHWRQRWEYEGRELVEFRGGHEFARRALAADEARGTWLQKVFGVDDGPRYQGHGRWRHAAGVSAWESNETWRPLPRRESKRDYQVLVARNRHTLTPTGWVHEQDNLKLRLGVGATAVARETGLNRYERVEDPRFSAGEAYWKDTQAYWGDVRAAWNTALGPGAWQVEERDSEGGARAERLMALADEVRKAGRYDANAYRPKVAELLKRAVTPATTTPARAAASR